MKKVLLTTVFAFYAIAAHATPQDWQAQLQKNISALPADNVATSGAVSVTEQNGQWRATLPVMTIKQTDGASWRVPNIIMLRSGNDVRITLPSSISKLDAAGKAAGSATIGQQNLGGTWNDANGRFQSLQGQLKQIKATQTQNSSQGSIDQIDIASADADTLTAKLTNATGVSVVEGKNYAAQVKNLTYSYQFKNANGLGIEQLIGLLQQNQLAAVKTPVTMKVDASDITFRNKPDVVNHIDRVQGQVMVTPKGDGKNADLRNNIDLVGLSQVPSKMNEVYLPKNVSMTGTVSSLPLAVLAMAPGKNVETIKQQMAASKTRVNFDSISMLTTAGAKMTGNGYLNANANVPTGFTGRINMKAENMASVMTALQQKSSAPGADMATQAQAMMTMLMLQGLGVQNNQATQFILDLTPEGQTLLNGKDISSLVKMGTGGGFGGMGGAGFQIPGLTAPNPATTE